MSEVKILIVTGRTGGHFFPAKTFAETLKNRNPEAEIHFVLSRRTSGALLEDEEKNSGYFHYLPSFPWKGLFTFKVFSFIVSFLKAFSLSRKLIHQLRPDLVVGFGSYLAVPVIITARMRGIPTLMHEQNAVMGKANRFLLPFVSQVAVSFSDTINHDSPQKFVHTGNIIRRELYTASLMKREEANGYFRILVLGGSQGASGLNKMVMEAVTQMKEGTRQKIKITHLAGEQDQEKVNATYRECGVLSNVLAFSNEMGRHYRAADLVISRSGAGTLFETVQFQIPSILIPYPYAGAHQFQNAEALAKGGNAWIVDQRSGSAGDLVRKIESLIENRGDLEHVKSRLRHILKVDDGESLCEVALSMIRRQVNSKNQELQTASN